MKNTHKLFAPMRLVYMADPDTGAESEKKAPETNPVADALEANADDPKEKLAKEAQEYCKTIETKMSESTKKLMETEDSLPGKPDPNDPRYQGKDGNDNFKKDNEAYAKKFADYKAEIKKLIPQMLSGMKKSPENAKVVDRIAQEEGADSKQGGAQTTSATPSYLAEKIYKNYKINGEPEGGWAVKDDLSDVPDLVKDGTIKLAKFKARSEVLATAVTDTTAKLEKIKEKYS